MEYFHEENYVLEKLAEEKAGWQSTHQLGRTMQGRFYFTQQQLSGFAVAFPLDSVTVTGSGFCMWLLTTEILDVEIGESWGQARALAYCPPSPETWRGAGLPSQRSCHHSQTGRAPQPWHLPKNKREHKNHLSFGLHSN